jgi:hypothetical protein
MSVEDDVVQLAKEAEHFCVLHCLSAVRCLYEASDGRRFEIVVGNHDTVETIQREIDL